MSRNMVHSLQGSEYTEAQQGLGGSEELARDMEQSQGCLLCVGI